MDTMKESVQRKEFKDILYTLAKDQDFLEDIPSRIAMYKRLETLYYAPEKANRFRHYYSDIFSVLALIRQDSSLGDINILGQNLSIILTGYQPVNRDLNGEIIDISHSIRKLYDHVSLDIARILYSDAGDRKIAGESAIAELQSQIKAINDNVENARQELKDQKKELSNQQKDYVAILGIFAAVVLAFTGGIAFSTSILDNIGSVSVYRLVLLSLLLGLVLIDVLFFLFYFIERVVHDIPIKSFCPLIICNALLFVLMALTFLGWRLGWVEARNKRVNNDQISLSECIVEQPTKAED